MTLSLELQDALVRLANSFADVLDIAKAERNGETKPAGTVDPVTGKGDWIMPKPEVDKKAAKAAEKAAEKAAKSAEKAAKEAEKAAPAAQADELGDPDGLFGEAEAEAAPQLTLEELRKAITEANAKSSDKKAFQMNFQKKVKELGAESLSKLDAGKYNDLLEALPSL